MIKITILCLVIFTANSSTTKVIWPFSYFFPSEETKQQRTVQYFNSESYLNDNAETKFDKLWEKIIENKNPGQFYSKIKTTRIITQDNHPTIDNKGDVLPEGRRKLIHSVGVVAKVAFNVVTKSKYTGLFNSGSQNALLRLSAAKDYDIKKSSAKQAYNNFAPGFGLKFLVNKKISENLVAMYDPLGQESWNFFKNTFTNNFRVNLHQDLENKLVSRSFAKVTNWISGVGLLGISSVKENGEIEKSPVFPYRLEFVPNPNLTKLFKDEYTEDFKDIISKIPSETLIYEVFAIDQPGCEPEKIGELVSKSEFTTSTFADRHLFFRHGLLDADDKHTKGNGRSEARDFYSFWGGFKEGKEPRAPIKKCPFGY